MNTSQILMLALIVGAILFLLQGIEMRLLKDHVYKLNNALRQTLKELARIHDKNGTLD